MIESIIWKCPEEIPESMHRIYIKYKDFSGTETEESFSQYWFRYMHTKEYNRPYKKMMEELGFDWEEERGEDDEDTGI